MKKPTWFRLSVTVISSIGILICPSQLKAQTEKHLENSFLQLVDQIRSDSNKAFLTTLKPSDEEVRMVFEEAFAKKAIEYNAKMWSTFENIPEDSMKPISEDAGIKILMTNAERLGFGDLGGLPEEYKGFADKLKPEVFMFGLQYLDARGQPEKTRTAFFYTNDRWVIIPLAYRAFL